MKIFLWVIGGFGALFAIGLAFNVLNTASSVATAPGRVVQQTMQTDNIINNYEWFHQAHANYQSRLRQIVSHRQFYNAETNPAEKSRLRMEMSAMQQSCRELATTYNARATMTNRSIFMGREAPTELNSAACE